MNTNKKVSLISDKDYAVVSRRNGSPFLVESEKTRIYANKKLNGTTLSVFIVARYFGGYDKSSISVEEFKMAYSNYKKEKKEKSALFLNAKKAYSIFTSGKDITKKEPVVLSPYARAEGIIKRFELLDINTAPVKELDSVILKGKSE